MNAFALFVKDYMKNHLPVAPAQIPERFEEAGKEWERLSAKEKGKYSSLAVEEILNHHEQIAKINRIKVLRESNLSADNKEEMKLQVWVDDKRN